MQTEPVADSRGRMGALQDAKALSGLAARVARRRELTVSLVLIVAFAYFSFAGGRNGFLTGGGARDYLEQGAEIGIIGAPLTLLMTAGEFDLSVGSMIGAAEIITALGVTKLHWPLLATLLLVLAAGAIVGIVNARMVVKSGLPSFLITLGGMFVILGLAEGGGILLLGSTTIVGIQQYSSSDPLLSVFNGQVFTFVPVSALWWIAATVLAAWVLHKARIGNWIQGIGGNLDSAQRSGIPVLRIKTYLYIATASSAGIVGMLNAYQVNQASSDDGQNVVFAVVTACVIGGTLISGGRGSALGTMMGALLFGVISEGFFFTNIPSQWYNLFLGLTLLAAIFMNKYVGDSLTLRVPRRKTGTLP
jgi:simple sugar transport system permease protein